jgi:hypothetical protein
MATKQVTDKRSGKRFYTWTRPDGTEESYWSVTTVIKGGVPMPALPSWAARTVAESVVADWKLVQEYMAKGDDQETIDWLKRRPWTMRSKAADRGSAIHKWLEGHVLAQTPVIPEGAEPFIRHVRQWIKDYGLKRSSFLASEAVVYSRGHSYAGTLDMILRIGDRTFIVDLKTADAMDKGPYSEVALQMAMYARADFIGLPDGTEAPLPEVDGAAVLHVSPEGYKFLEVDISPPVFRSALYAREVFRWAEETSKTVIGDTVPLPEPVAA